MDSSMLSSSCRCCASEGAYKDVKSSYHWMGEEEIYADMLKECFDVTLSPASDGLNEGGICEICITQLRNAANFKKQVLHTEEQFKNKLQSGFFKPEIVKVEVPGEDGNDTDDNNASVEEGFSGPEFDVPIKSESPEEPKAKKRAAKKGPTTRAKKAKSEDAETSTKREQLNAAAMVEKVKPLNLGLNQMIINNAIKVEVKKQIEIHVKKEDSITRKDNAAPQVEKPKGRTSNKEELLKHRHNIAQVLEFSNATPIRRKDGIEYLCSYCDKKYQLAADLKKHTLESHIDVKTAIFMSGTASTNFYVKLDITELHCTLCGEDMASLEDLLDHLIRTHEKKFHHDIKNRMMPLKFDSDSLKCCICSKAYDKFKILLVHMHTHYSNYTCEICGAGFINPFFLFQHADCHKLRKYKCDFCPEVFATYPLRRSHGMKVHSQAPSMNRCAYCEEAFIDYRMKEKHQHDVHGVKSIECKSCDKTFKTTRALRVHVKRDHLMERKHKCTQCDMRFYEAGRLKTHMLKHTGVKEFQCEVCMKSFGRKYTLNIHMRSHEDDRRYKCDHCGQAFLQKCSWKGHMRNKHSEIVK